MKPTPVTPAPPAPAERLSDETVAMIHSGLLIPNADALQSMWSEIYPTGNKTIGQFYAYMIRVLRGTPNPGTV